MQVLLVFMAFMNFLFYPLVIAFFIALIIEQIFRSQKKPSEIFISMRIRKFLWQQAWIVNVAWFVGYAIILFTVGKQSPQMPDMIWEGQLS
tara:strand:+ start:87 stop:359 length:273 start_codon:yes stop_codon:yes gene_type:complete